MMAPTKTAAKTDLRSDARVLFENSPWPNPEIEEWRRTWPERLLPKGALDEAAAQSSTSEDPTPVNLGDLPGVEMEDGYTAKIVMEAGRPVAAAVSSEFTRQGGTLEWRGVDDLPESMIAAGVQEIDEAGDRVVAWHWRDLPGTVAISVPAGMSGGKPVLVEYRVEASPESSSIHLPHLHMDIGRGSELEVVWSLTGGASAPAILNAGITGSIADDSRLRLALRQILGKHASLFLHGRITTGRDALCGVTESHLGGALVKTRLRVVLAEPGSRAELNGVYLAGEGVHMDVGTIQDHAAPHATSDAVYKGAIRPGGRSVYQGLIKVAENAAKTDAYLTNKNIVLGKGARADSIPKLNILTDDVKCSHGSTTGKVPKNQLFYLISRGFSPEEAERELVRGFLAEALAKAPEVARDLLEADLDAALDGKAFG